MANPYFQFAPVQAAPRNPYLSFAQPEEPEEEESPWERLRRNQERLLAAGAMPGLNDDAPPTEPGRPLQHEAVSQILSRVKRGIVGLGELPQVGSNLVGAAQRALLPESLEPIADRRQAERDAALQAIAPDPLQGMAENVREEYAGAKDRLGNLGEAAGLPPWATAAADTALEGAAVVADPTNFIPGGAALKGGSRLGRAARRVAPVVDEALETLARRAGGLDALAPEGFDEFLTELGWKMERGFDEARVTTPDGKTRSFRGPDAREKAERWVEVENERLLSDAGKIEYAEDPASEVLRDIEEARQSWIKHPSKTVDHTDPAQVLAHRKIADQYPDDPTARALNPGNDEVEWAHREIANRIDRRHAELDRAEAEGRLVDPRTGSTLSPAANDAVGHLARAEISHAQAAEALLGPEIHVAKNPGEAGFVKIRANSAPGSPGFFQKWFTNWGDYAAMGREIGEVTAEAKRLTGSAIKTEGKRAELLVRDAALAIKQHQKALAKAGMNRPLDETLEYVLSGLEGEHAFEGAEVLGERMAAARQHLDRLSMDFEAELADLLEKDLIKGPTWQERAKDLRSVIRQNKGEWTRRSFQAFRNGDWEDLVKAPDSPERWRWDNFVEWSKGQLREAEPDLADDVLQLRAEGLGNKYLRRDPEVFLGFGERTLLPTEKLGSARARLDLPQQIDDLLGLDTDPLVRYRESVLSLAHDIESLRFKKRLLEMGDGKIFFDQPTGTFSAQVQGASGLDPLAGRYTSPEIHAVIAAATDGAREAAGLMAKTSALVKAGKTVYSPFVTHPRNLFSWVPMLAAQGHLTPFVSRRFGDLAGKAINPRRWATSAATVAAGKIAKGGAAERALNAGARLVKLADGRTLADVKDYSKLDYLRERLLALQKAGVVGESTTAGDVGHFLGVAGEVKSLNALKGTAAARGFGRFQKAMEWMYGAEDDLGKVLSFDATYEDLRWAMDGASEEEIFAETARRIRDTTPTYSKIAPVTRKLRDSPILSAFPTFTQEVYRNTKNGLVTALTDIKSPNPKMRLLGAKRLGGLVTAAASAPTLAAAGMYTTGISKEGIDALREFVAPWDRSANLAPVSVDGYKISTVNLSYMMPHSIFAEPIIAAAIQVAQNEGPVEDVVEASLSAAWEAGEPFLSREILVDGILDFAWKTRGEFWDKNKPVDVNARAIANALWRTVTPGGLLWIERVARAAGAGDALEEEAADMEAGPSKSTVEFIASLLQQVNEYGKEYKLDEELVAGGTGIRAMSYDVYDGLGYKARTFKRVYSDASAMKNRAERHPGKLPPGTLLERRREANQQFRSGWDELRRAVEAMRTIGKESGIPQGIIDRDIRRKLKEEQVGQKWIRSVMYGAYEDPY